MFVAKISRRDFVPRTFALIAPLHPVLHRVSCSYEKIPNMPKHYAMYKNMSLGSNGVDWVHSLQKNPDVTSWHVLLHQWHQFTLFCTEFHAVMKRSQMHPNTVHAPKHEFRVQWGGLGAFVAINPDVTSWHELLH